MGWIVFTVNVILPGTIFAVALSAGVLVLLEIGRRIGVRQLNEGRRDRIKGPWCDLWVVGFDPRIFVFRGVDEPTFTVSRWTTGNMKRCSTRSPRCRVA
jgi:hypothetical protein